MKIAKKLKVAGHNVRVVTPDRVRSVGGANTIGLAEYSRDVIRIAWRDQNGNRLSRDYRDETYLHEILHHVADKYDARLSEVAVGRLARGLYQVLKDNKIRF